MQTYGPLEAEWDSQELATQMLRKFQAFANKVIAHVICKGFHQSPIAVDLYAR